jgi:hypothetical protein
LQAREVGAADRFGKLLRRDLGALATTLDEGVLETPVAVPQQRGEQDGGQGTPPDQKFSSQ